MTLVNIFDYKKKASEKIDKMAFDYIIGGSQDELTLSRNRAAFQKIKLKQYVLRDVSKISLTCTILDFELPHPILLSPVSLHQLSHPRGELETAEAAEELKTIMFLSSLSSNSLEDVANASTAHKVFQLYWYKDKDLTKSMVERAELAGYKGICLTVDAPVLGHREKDTYNRFSLPEGVKLRNFASIEQMMFPESTEQAVSGLTKYVVSQFDNSITWKDLEWLKSITNLPIMLKGIQTQEDAKLALDHGLSAIVVSNHGGRQLDGSLATIECLPRIADEVKGEMEIYLDSGIRRGSDIFKAIALGADAVMIGRPYIWGLAVNGKQGIKHVFEILEAELKEIMALVGCTSIKAISSDFIEKQTIPNFG